MIKLNGAIRMGWLPAVGLLGLAIGMGAVVALSFAWRQATPELLRNLSAEGAEASRQLTERLGQTLPTGVLDDKVIEVLSAQGFTIRRRRPLIEQVQYATFTISNVACVQNVHVAWRVNTAGHASGVKGSVEELICW